MSTLPVPPPVIRGVRRVGMRSSAQRATWDAVVVGGGHNGLVAAAYLARAGRRVLVLERLGHVGGAAVSDAPFPGVDARLSRYSYLVSLLPRQIVDDLGLDVRPAPRAVSSYTPRPRRPARGLLVGRPATPAHRRVLRALTGGGRRPRGLAALLRPAPRGWRGPCSPPSPSRCPPATELRAQVGDDALWAAPVRARRSGEAVDAALRRRPGARRRR